MHTFDASGSEASSEELRSFGKYHLIASLGQGGMAKVFLALLAGPSDFNKLVVIKIMRHDALLASDEVMRMFRAEARLAARLVHPNIVHTHEVGEHDGRAFMAMEYLDGQPLSKILNRARVGRDLPLDEIVRVLSEIARGLHYAHQLRGFQGEDLHVVHRDVSPQNVIVTYEGHGKLVDFGIAKTSESEATQLGIIKGKLDYIAPEQLRGEPVDARADVFALGAILWEVVTGQRFAGGRKCSDVQKVQARLAGGERQLTRIKPDAPAELAGIVTRAIALTPEDRFQDAAAFADALDAYLEHEQLRPNARALSARMHRLFVRERADLHKLIEHQVARVKRLREQEGEQAREPSGPAIQNPRGGSGAYAFAAHQEERSSIHTGAAARASTIAPARRESTFWWLIGGMLVATTLALVWLDARPPHDASQALLQVHPLPRPAKKVASAQPSALERPRFLPAGSAPLRPRAAVAEAFSPAVFADPAERAAAEAFSPALGADAPARATGAEALAPAPALVVVDNSVTIDLTVSPAQASVLLDGVRVRVPFRGSFRKDATLHHLSASAVGYRPSKEFVTFDRDRSIEIELERVGTRQLGQRPAGTSPSLRGKRQARDGQLAPLLERPNPYTTD